MKQIKIFFLKGESPTLKSQECVEVIGSLSFFLEFYFTIRDQGILACVSFTEWLINLAVAVSEFVKSRAMRACVPTWSTCQRAKSVPSFHFYMPTCQKACQRTIRCTNVLTWHANVPNGVPIFQLGVPTCQRAYQFSKHSSCEMLREIFIFYYYIKNYTLYLISYLYML